MRELFLSMRNIGWHPLVAHLLNWPLALLDLDVAAWLYTGRTPLNLIRTFQARESWLGLCYLFDISHLLLNHALWPLLGRQLSVVPLHLLLEGVGALREVIPRDLSKGRLFAGSSQANVVLSHLGEYVKA